MHRKNLTYGLLAILAALAAFAAFGHPIIQPEALAGLGILPMAAGTTFNDLANTLEELGKKSDEWREKKGAEIDALRGDVQELAKKSGRPDLGGIGRQSAGDTKALGQALIKAATGDDRELKAMSVGSDPGGGFLVIPQMDATVRQIREVVSPMSGLARNVDLTSGAELLLPHFRGTLASAWVGENAARPNTETVPLWENSIPLHEVYCAPKVSQKLLDTANYDVGSILLDQIAHGLAVAEAVALHTGDGVIRPRGFTTYTTAATADDTRTWGQVEHIATGVSGNFAATNPADHLIDMVTALAPQYRPNARWLMSRSTAARIKKFKDSNGQYLWQPSLQLGQPESLLGYPVVISDNVPAVAANSLSVWFGDWQQAYCTVRMPGLRLLHDPYSDHGQVTFYAYSRVGGGLVNSEAIKALKFA